MFDDPLYDQAGAGRRIGGDRTPVSTRTMERMRQVGTGPKFIKVGRLVRYRQSDLDEYLNARAYRSTAEAQAAELDNGT